ncbi:MAG: hypothetical protein HKN78_12870 [Sphingomonadaceae bacterium]|nr:hypothetical protein [Sphingomonadaceae bacterium]
MKDENKGEGNYKASKDFQKDQHEFAKDSDKVDAKAREAADALKGEEGDALEKARKESAEGHPKK